MVDFNVAFSYSCYWGSMFFNCISFISDLKLQFIISLIMNVNKEMDIVIKKFNRVIGGRVDKTYINFFFSPISQWNHVLSNANWYLQRNWLSLLPSIGQIMTYWWFFNIRVPFKHTSKITEASNRWCNIILYNSIPDVVAKKIFCGRPVEIFFRHPVRRKQSYIFCWPDFE